MTLFLLIDDSAVTIDLIKASWRVDTRLSLLRLRVRLALACFIAFTNRHGCPLR